MAFPTPFIYNLPWADLPTQGAVYPVLQHPGGQAAATEGVVAGQEARVFIHAVAQPAQQGVARPH